MSLLKRKLKTALELFKNFIFSEYGPKPKYRLLSRYTHSPLENTTVVFVSAHGNKFNGGVKLYNVWVKLLRENGVDAYFATEKGDYEKWLVNHQPVISYKDIEDLRNKGRKVVIACGWLQTSGLEKLIGDGQFYYFDADLKHTIRFRKQLKRFLRKDAIAGIATHSRYIQSWYMARYGIRPILINEWSDQDIFYPEPKVRVKGRVGCMVDAKEDEAVFDLLKSKCEKSSLCESIVHVKGDEKAVSQTMRTLDIFVGLNQGKHPLWGEGCPRTQQEAIHAGAVLAAFDVLGNREYLYHNWTGVSAPPNDPDKLWYEIETLLSDKEKKEKLRKEGFNLVGELFSTKGKINLACEFLGLEGMEFELLKTIFPQKFYLHRHEVPFLSKMVAQAKETIVEIGCAFGGSTTVLLLNAPLKSKVFSIDPFVKDSQGVFQANESVCRRSVKTALSKMNKLHALKGWTLMSKTSQEAEKSWERQIDLLFIDGSHKYEDVKNDFEIWSRHVAPEGKIILHDSRKDNIEKDPEDKKFSRGWAGPTRLTNEISSGDEFEIVEICYSMTVFRRKGTP